MSVLFGRLALMLENGNEKQNSAAICLNSEVMLPAKEGSKGNLSKFRLENYDIKQVLKAS